MCLDSSNDLSRHVHLRHTFRIPTVNRGKKAKTLQRAYLTERTINYHEALTVNSAQLSYVAAPARSLSRVNHVLLLLLVLYIANLEKVFLAHGFADT